LVGWSDLAATNAQTPLFVFWGHPVGWNPNFETPATLLEPSAIGNLGGLGGAGLLWPDWLDYLKFRVTVDQWKDFGFCWIENVIIHVVIFYWLSSLSEQGFSMLKAVWWAYWYWMVSGFRIVFFSTVALLSISKSLKN
jgi:hypothetical protein